MRLEHWLASRSDIAHRDEAIAAGFSDYAIKVAVASGAVRRVARGWIALPAADPQLDRAARERGRVTCVSAAARIGLWVPATPPDLHLRVAPTSSRHGTNLVLHWNVPPMPVSRFALVEPVTNVLDAVARCLPFESALCVWESAVRKGKASPDQLRRVVWSANTARRLAAAAGALSDSGLESIFMTRIRPFGLPVRQQVWIDGHPVDALIGDRLVIQLDGWEHHGEARNRRRDLAQDARLVLLGYTVLRFDYQQVLFDWPLVEATIMGAVAQGLHRAA